MADEFEPDPCYFCQGSVWDENGHWLVDDVLLWAICAGCMANPEIKTAVDRYEAAVRRAGAREKDLRAVWQKFHKKLPGEGE